MNLLRVCVWRDWLVMRTRTPALLFDLFAVLMTAVVFYYLAQYLDRGQDFFPFVLAGLTIVRIHGAVPRVLASSTARIADGSLEVLMSGRARPAVVFLSEGAFELARGMVLAIGVLLVGVGVFGADVTLTAPGLAAVAVGLVGATLILLALSTALLALLMVLREAGAVGSFSGVLLPILGGVYFPLTILPAPLESIARVLPFHVPVDVIRSGLTAGVFPTTQVAVLAGACAASLAIAALLARPAVQHARRAGRLALE
ncbi:MAG: ABC transporter permease [Solirubrobacteraceae bacterium]|nr:ABC transporter permease [Solirubrobacteraceae bacterium]